MALRGSGAPRQNATLVSELRLGNKIIGKRLSDHSDEVITVMELRQSGVIYHRFKADYSNRGVGIVQGIDPADPMLSGWIKPLQVAPEWLLALGFEPTNHENSVYKQDGLNLSVIGSQATLREGSHHFGRAFQHVHQLQNLYLAVTGSELVKTENQPA